MAETIYESVSKTNLIIVDRIVDFQIRNNKKFEKLKIELKKTNEEIEKLKKQTDLTEKIALATQKLVLTNQSVLQENEKSLINLVNRIDRIENHALARIDRRLDMFNERLKLRESPDTITDDDS